MSDDTYALRIAFPDQSESFVHGWEAGQIYEAMQRGDTPINGQCHAANREVIERTAEAEGYLVSFDVIDGFPGYLTYSASRIVPTHHTN